MDVKQVSAASIRIADLMAEMALQNAEVVSADPSAQATIVFNASVGNLARILCQMCAKNKGSAKELSELFPKIQYEIFQVCMKMVEENTRNKVTIVRKDP